MAYWTINESKVLLHIVLIGRGGRRCSRSILSDKFTVSLYGNHAPIEKFIVTVNTLDKFEILTASSKPIKKPRPRRQVIDVDETRIESYSVIEPMTLK